MTLTRDLHRLAHAHGVQIAWLDPQGRRVRASTGALLDVLAALGAPVTSLDDVPDALRERTARTAATLTEPVAVAWDGQLPPLSLRLPAGWVDTGRIHAELALESGSRRTFSWDADTLPRVAGDRRGHESIVICALDLGLELPLGYHELRLSAGDRQARVTLLSAPERADSRAITGARSRLTGDSGPRSWGAFMPTHALRDEQDWGCGDYTRLAQLTEWVADHGGRTVATLPLLSGFMDGPLHEPSPYSPVSRLAWNELFVDPTAAPEWRHATSARELTTSPDWRSERDALRQAELVDYRRLAQLKRPVLAALADALVERGGPRRLAYESFLEQRPLVHDYARFRAACDARGSAWPTWPERQRSGRLREAALNPALVRLHGYGQFLAHEQLRRLASDGRRRHVGLTLDLPLGVHACGYDTWRWHDLFAHEISAGAPPDSFFTRGQNWGFPPPLPQAMRADGYRYLVRTIRHHAEYASILRVDHVMHLHRLYWVPHGRDAADGVYVHGHPDEHYAVLCLESHRQRVALIGEDLGSVSRGVREAMTRHDIRRLNVMQYAVGGAIPALSCPHGVSSLGTHDMPSFEGFRRGLDIDDAERLGLMDESAARRATRRREALMEELRHWLKREGHLQGSPARGLVAACLSQLAAGPSPLLLVNLEDLWHEPSPHNVPGTHSERPNWRRRARHGCADFDGLPEVVPTLARLASLRTGPVADRRGEQQTILDDLDLGLFSRGIHRRMHQKLGSRPAVLEGVAGTHFLHWAPGAQSVCLRGDFNDWHATRHPMQPRDHDLWELFVPGARVGQQYTYRVQVARGSLDRADPAARAFAPRADSRARFDSEVCPASIICAPEHHQWRDERWLLARRSPAQPELVELPHSLWVGARADRMAARVLEFLGTQRKLHVVFPTWMERLPLTHEPRGLTGDFAPAASFGSPAEVMALVDELHRNDVGVILSWPPEGPAVDDSPLHSAAVGRSDEDSRGTAESYLLSSAAFWLETYHVDGLRILTRALRDRAGVDDSLRQAAEILQRMQGLLADRDPGVVLLPGWRERPMHAAGPQGPAMED